MKNQFTSVPARYGFRAAALFAAVLVFCGNAGAQFFPGGGGGGGGRSSRNSSSQRTYTTPGTVGDAVISVDSETRSLVIIADDETSQYISQVVSNLDTPRPQVLIKVVFLEVTHTDGSDIGLEGYFTKSGGSSWTSGFVTNFGVVDGNIVPTSIEPAVQQSTISGTTVGGLGTPAFSSIPANSGLYQLLSEDYQVTLRAIAQTGKVKVLSRPSIIARNNQPATINVGQSVPLVTGVRYDNFGNAINSYNYTDIGIILQVTPFITGDGMVEMIVSPETSDLVSDRSQWVPISSSDDGIVSAPLINSRSADTVVVTPDGQTVIIGGLMHNSNAETVTKVPYLGDVPLLGALFRRTVKQDSKTELLIFLTPHIIEAPSQLAKLTDKERSKSDAMKVLTPKELDKYLGELPPPETPATAPKGKKNK